MKAIYLNIDPYLQAVADWLNAGKPGTAPSFDPLPVAVTIPLGESAVFFMQTGTFADGAAAINPWGDNDLDWNVGPSSSISDDSIPGEGTGGEASGVALSSILQSQKTYWGHVGNLDSFNAIVRIADDKGNNLIYITFPVLVRRETASGPVDLVDFTPPAAAIAAGTDLKGCTFDGNAIEAAADTGVLSAPAAGG
jgi:hypothetical protein